MTGTLDPEPAARRRRADRPHRRRRRAPMLVIAHRGVSSELPENTLPAFERAIEVGADYVELDVHADADGRLVVTHEPPRARREYPTARGRPRPDARAHRRHGRAEDAEPLPQASRRAAHDRPARPTTTHSSASSAPRSRRRARLRPGLRTVQHVGFAVSIRGARGAWAAGFYDPRVTRRGHPRRAGARPRPARLHRERRAAHARPRRRRSRRHLHRPSRLRLFGISGRSSLSSRIRTPSAGSAAATRVPTGSPQRASASARRRSRRRRRRGS